MTGIKIDIALKTLLSNEKKTLSNFDLSKRETGAEEKREKIELLYPTRAMREPCLHMPSQK